MDATPGRSNPPISPSPEDNIWKFETRNMGDNSRVDCNFDVPGFKIYGRFRNAQVHARRCWHGLAVFESSARFALG